MSIKEISQDLENNEGNDKDFDELKENDYDKDFEKFKKISAPEATQVIANFDFLIDLNIHYHVGSILSEILLNYNFLLKLKISILW